MSESEFPSSPEKPLYVAMNLKTQFQWRLQDTENARILGHLSRPAIRNGAQTITLQAPRCWTQSCNIDVSLPDFCFALV